MMAACVVMGARGIVSFSDWILKKSKDVIWENIQRTSVAAMGMPVSWRKTRVLCMRDWPVTRMTRRLSCIGRRLQVCVFVMLAASCCLCFLVESSTTCLQRIIWV